MPGPLPKPDEQRRRRNAPTIPTTNLPVSGYRGPIPEPSEELGDDLSAKYEELWRSPMGAAWHESDADVVVELVRLRRATSKLLDRGEFPPGHVTGRIGAIEDRLGLTPKARAGLRWRIVDDPPDEDEENETVGRAWDPEDFVE